MTPKDSSTGTPPPPQPTDKADAPKPSEGVPEKYEFKLPEGAQVDAALVEKATPLFKELGLSNEAAGKLVDFYNTQAEALATAGRDAFDKMRGDWRNEVFSDKSLGDGKALRPEVNQAIGSVFGMLDTKAAADFRSALDLTGAGDNPGVIRGLYALSKLLTEGKSVSGGNPSPLGQRAPGQGPKSAASALYPNLPSSNA